MKKKWYRSKMLWVNLIGVTAIAISVACSSEEMAHEILASEGAILAVVNLILRLITNTGLEV